MTTKIKSSNLDSDLQISGSFTANNIVGSVSGNADTASALQTARTITIGGTGKSFNGTSNVIWSLSEIGVGTLGQQNNDSVTITGGTIDGTVIGGSTPAAISGTTGNFSSNLNVGFSTMIVNTANNRVGIGTTNPQTSLDVRGNIFSSDIFRKTNFSTAGFPSFQPGDDSNTGMFQQFSDTLGFSTNGVERLRITSTGNVGIGTSSPSEALTVQGNILSNSSVRASGLISTGDATAPHFSFSSDTDTGMFRATTDNLGFSTSGVERIRITSTGSVGIGTSSPTSALTVQGTITGTAVTQSDLDLTVGRLTKVGDGGLLTNNAVTSTGDVNDIRYGAITAPVNQTNAPANEIVLWSGGRSGGARASQMAIGHAENTEVFFRGYNNGRPAGSEWGPWNRAFHTGNISTIDAVSQQIFRVDNTEHMRITNTGNVGIGTTSGLDGSLTTSDFIQVRRNTDGWILRHNRTDNTRQMGLFATDHSSPNMALHTNGTERMRITSAGNVGIGTSSPATRMHISTGPSGATSVAGLSTAIVENNSDAGITILTPNTSIGSIAFGDPENGAIGRIRYAHSNNAMTFSTNATERLRITSAGNVGIGTSSPAANLDVTGTTILGTSASAGPRIRLIPSGNDFFIQPSNSSTAGTGTKLRFSKMFSATTTFTIDTGLERVGVGTTDPVERLHVSGNQLIDGVLTIQQTNGNLLNLRTTDGSGVGINFTDQSSGAQNGTIRYVHIDTLSFGSSAAFLFEGTEPTQSYVFGTQAKILPDVNNTGVIGNSAFTWSNGHFSNLTVNGSITLGAAGTATTHAVRADRTLTAGDGLSGGGNLTANRTFAVDGTVVRTSGDQTILGTKTFNDRLIIDPSNVSVTNAATKFMAGTGVTAIGTTANSYIYPFEYQYKGGSNNVRLLISGFRRDAGTAWQGTAYRIQYAVDNSFTDGSRAYLDLGTRADGNGYVSLGTASTDRLYIDSTGRVGIGSTTPTNKLTVSAGASDGIFVEDNNNAGNSPFVKVRGNRSDGNASQSFSGKLLLEGYRTDAAVGSTKHLGTVAFGGNHTNGSATNILYPASISGISEGTFSNATTMPTALTFYTGSIGRTDTAVNATFGTERMRIDSAGGLRLGAISGDLANTRLTIQEGSQGRGIEFFTSGGNQGGIIGTTGESGATNGLELNASRGGGTLRFKTNGTERLRITTAGNVGIGTSSPVYFLDVTRANHNVARFVSTGTNSGPDVLIVDQDNNNTRAALQIQGNAGSNEVLFASSGGNVGIGTSSPAAKVHISDAIGNNVFIGANQQLLDPGTSNTGAIYFGATSGNPTAGIEASWGGASTPQLHMGVTRDGRKVRYSAFFDNTLRMFTSDVERIRIASNGDFLFRKSIRTPTADGVELRTDGIAIFTNRSGLSAQFRRVATSSLVLVQFFGGTDAETLNGAINVTGTSTIYATSSDYRLKENITPITNASQRLLSLNPVNFAWKSNGTRTDGFLAHEAQEIVPDAVTGIKDEINVKGNPEYQGLDQSKLVPLLTAALQEALTEIASLKTRLDAANL